MTKPSTHCLRKMFTDVLKTPQSIYCFLNKNVVNTCVIWFWAVSSVGRASRLHRPSSNKLNLHLNKQSQHIQAIKDGWTNQAIYALSTQGIVLGSNNPGFI